MDRVADATSAETAAIGVSGVPITSASSAAEEGRFVPGTLMGGRYRIIDLLGRGGMGEVYRATDLTLGQSVALKFLPEEASRDQRLLERFHGEVRIARQVSHPNVCRVYDIGEFAGTPFLSMEYVDGEDLASLLPRIGRLPADKAVETARKICAGLAAAHDRGIIHRDLKPANIMINKRGDVVIMDFGLAALASALSGPEVRNGTPAYMAPEQLKGTEVSERSDIYALGLVLYELFTGRRPYDGNTLKKLLQQQEAAHLTSMTSIAADIDPAVEKVIRRCLHPDPAMRPGTAQQVAAALPGGDPLAAALAAGETPSPEIVAAAGRTEGLPRRYAVPCLAVIALGLFAVPLIRQQTDALVHAPLDYPPQVLAQKARDLAAAFGYKSRPADTALELNYRDDLLDYLKKLPEPRRWTEWLAAEAPIAATYRESPKPLYADPFGQVTRDNPAPVEPGMASVVLDGSGRLREFSAIPYETGQEAAPEGSGPPPDTVFRAAGLDMAAFAETTPPVVPRAPADQLFAWKGPHPVLPGAELTVEAGYWKGRVTFAKVLAPWDKPAPETGQSPNTLTKAIGYAMAVGLFFVLLRARRNWKLERADRRGALRVAAARFLLAALAWIGTVHAIPDNRMLSLSFQEIGEWMLAAGLLWVLYIALEPELRAGWPHSVVTWNRILAGRWKDAQVGAHILIGAATGVLIWVGAELTDVFFGSRQLGAEGGLEVALGTRRWLATHIGTLGNVMIVGFALFLVIFGIRRLVKKNLPAAILASALLVVFNNPAQLAEHWQTVIPVYFVMFAILIFVLLRLGLVALFAEIFFVNSCGKIIVGADWTTWYAPYGLATLALLVGIAVFAFRQSLGSRVLLPSDEAEST
jgi:predicted Ser/Thr protein kinase